MPDAQRFGSFAEFWPFYVREHLDPRSRALHVAGSALVLVALMLALTVSAWWLLVMPVIGYGFAWVGHFVFEKNRPATFTHPLWSLIGDWKMFWFTVTGRMGAELDRVRSGS